MRLGVPITIRLPVVSPSLRVFGWRDPGVTSIADADDAHRFALALPLRGRDRERRLPLSGWPTGDSLALPRAHTGQVAAHPDRHRGAARRLRGREAVVPGEPAVFFTTAGYDGSPLSLADQSLAPDAIGRRPDTSLARTSGIEQSIGEHENGFQYISEVRR